jgi:hypothetical protein
MAKDLCVPDEIAAIRADIYVHGGASAGTLARIESLVHRFPDSPDLWVLRGDAIQLGDGTGPSLDEARKSYEHALAIDSGHREAASELQHFIETHEDV